MPLFFLASFPNSRIKPRPPRSTGTAVIVAVPTGVATQILPSDANRTDLIVRNLDSVNTIWYGYSNTVDGITVGFPLKPGEAQNVDGPQALFIYQNSGAPINVSYDIGQG